eukprot:7342878-Prymnesium_polylepis.1
MLPCLLRGLCLCASEVGETSAAGALAPARCTGNACEAIATCRRSAYDTMTAPPVALRLRRPAENHGLVGRLAPRLEQAADVPGDQLVTLGCGGLPESQILR